MPYYLYRCQSCGKEVEVAQKAPPTPEFICTCGGKAVRQFTPFGFTVNGGTHAGKHPRKEKKK